MTDVAAVASGPTVFEVVVRTAAGAIWEAGMRRVRDGRLAVQAARALRTFLRAAPAEAIGPRWAFALRDAIGADDDSPAAVEVLRGEAEPIVCSLALSGETVYYGVLDAGGAWEFVPATDNADSPVAGTLTLSSGRTRCAYGVEEYPADWGRGFRLVKAVPETGTDPSERSYSVLCGFRLNECDCRGFAAYNQCKHATALAALVALGAL